MAYTVFSLFVAVLASFGVFAIVRFAVSGLSERIYPIAVILKGSENTDEIACMIAEAHSMRGARSKGIILVIPVGMRSEYEKIEYIHKTGIKFVYAEDIGAG